MRFLKSSYAKKIDTFYQNNIMRLVFRTIQLQCKPFFKFKDVKILVRVVSQTESWIIYFYVQKTFSTLQIILIFNVPDLVTA